jgi:hypothetical protein
MIEILQIGRTEHSSLSENCREPPGSRCQMSRGSDNLVTSMWTAYSGWRPKPDKVPGTPGRKSTIRRAMENGAFRTPH